MYESFFDLQERPFATTPRVDRYFPAAAIEAARDTLSRTIERAEGIGLVIGPSGSGKTLLLEVLARQYAERFTIASIAGAKLSTRRALLQAILFEAGLPYRRMEEGELRLALLDHLRPSEKSPNGMVILFDECHTLAPKLLEELRLLTNVVRDGQPRVRLVLAGGSVMEDRFAQPKMQPFQQRITARCYLEAFSHAETLGYIQSQLAAAGGQWADVMTDAALAAVHQASDGVPRVINQICDHAMIMAAAGGVRPIDAAGIEEAWADLQQLPLPWNVPNDEADEAGGTIEFGLLDDEDDDVEWSPDEPAPQRSAIGHAAQAEVQPHHMDLDRAEEVNPPHDEQLPEPIAPGVSCFDEQPLVEPTEQLDEIERQLAEATQDFYPPGRHEPEIVIEAEEESECASECESEWEPEAIPAAPAPTTAADPFANDEFEEEEVVLNPTLDLDPGLLTQTLRSAPPAASTISYSDARPTPVAPTRPAADPVGQPHHPPTGSLHPNVILCDDVVLPQIEITLASEFETDSPFAPAEDPVLPEDRLECQSPVSEDAELPEAFSDDEPETDEQTTLPLHSFIQHHSDGDMIFIEEDEPRQDIDEQFHRSVKEHPRSLHEDEQLAVGEQNLAATRSSAKVRQQEYRNLFARLRRGE